MAKWANTPHGDGDVEARLAASGLRVKPLVWEPWPHGIATASSHFGPYDVWKGYFRAPMKIGQPAQDPIAAAEADHRERVLAMLEVAE